MRNRHRYTHPSINKCTQTNVHSHTHQLPHLHEYTHTCAHMHACTQTYSHSFWSSVNASDFCAKWPRIGFHWNATVWRTRIIVQLLDILICEVDIECNCLLKMWSQDVINLKEPWRNDYSTCSVVIRVKQSSSWHKVI